MKPLTDLISEVQNVEEKANEYAEIHHIQGQGLFGNILEDFKAGALSQSPIADALREAIEALEVNRTECAKFYERYRKQIQEHPIGGFVCDRELASAKCLEKLRAILEGKDNTK